MARGGGRGGMCAGLQIKRVHLVTCVAAGYTGTEAEGFLWHGVLPSPRALHAACTWQV